MAQVLRVMPAPNQALACTNALYVSPNDATTPYVQMGTFIYKCIPHPEVEDGTVRMNAIARRQLGYGVDKVTLTEFNPRYMPSVANLVVTAEPVKRDPYLVVAPTDLVNIIRNNLEGQIVCFDQKFTVMAGDHAILVTVTGGNVQGMVDARTQINMMWQP